MASDGPSVLESAGVPGASAGKSDEGHADAHGVAGWLLWGGETVGDVSPVTNDALRGCHAIHLAAPSGMWQGLVSALCGWTLAIVLPHGNFYVRCITLGRASIGITLFGALAPNRLHAPFVAALQAELRKRLSGEIEQCLRSN